MSNEEVPTREETRVVYEDKPNLLTMISGGALMAVFLFWISGYLLGTINLDIPILRYALAGIVLLASFRMGTRTDVVIRIDTQTGYVEASNNQYEYSGYAHEPEMFMVLEKKSTANNGRTFTDYKLSMKVDEETTFDVPLQNSEVRAAIRNVEKAKNAVPLRRDD